MYINEDFYLKTIMYDEIRIKIKMTSNSHVYTIKVLKSDTIQTLKEKCEKETSIPPQSQNLVYKGCIFSNEKLVSDYKIENDHTIILVKKHTASQPPQKIKQILKTQQLIIIQVHIAQIIIIITTIKICLWDLEDKCLIYLSLDL